MHDGTEGMGKRSGTHASPAVATNTNIRLVLAGLVAVAP